MKEENLRLAQQDIEEALKAVEDIEKDMCNSNLSKDKLKGKFVELSEKVQKLEDILKVEGIL